MTTLNLLQRRAPARPTLASRLADFAVAALVDEAMLTPKPGLVDMRGSGAHTDLTWILMCQSAHSLHPAFCQMAQAGQAIGDHEALRARIGAIGRDAERTMMQVTGGVNTHRGAIWALGLLTTAAAQCSGDAGAADVAHRAAVLARLADPHAPRRTGNKGELARLEHQVGGARGQAEAGFPQVLHAALPALRHSRARGDSEEAARINALLAVIAGLDDTCLLARGGRAALAVSQQGAQRVLDAGGVATDDGRAHLHALEAEMRARHVSPGGAADLLAAALLLDRIEQERVLETEFNHGKTTV
jgi:triphosphoribosyl-dephospho-CoA synthase